MTESFIQSSLNTLPAPDAAANECSQRLGRHIIEHIAAAGGTISFARFMDLALYAPGLGYYVNGTRKLGSGGDFVTAPEISSLFGACLSDSVKQVLSQSKQGAILEFGAGSGILAADILENLQQQQCLPQRYLILETSAELKQRQQRNLYQRVPALMDRIHWLDRLPDPGLVGIVIANEVLDAMPVHRFQVQHGHIDELCVGYDDSGFCWQQVPAPAYLASAVAQTIEELPEPLSAGYTSEINLNIGPWLNSIAERLQCGAVLLIDYGYPRAEYYHPQRSEGTLMCHYQHRAHPDPLILPGIQDITAYVDFTAVAEGALNAGMEVAGFCSQAQYLLGTGVLDQIMADAGDNPQRQLQLAQQLKTLTLPGEMGERFKVMTLTKNIDPPKAKHPVFDLRGRL